MSQSTTSPATVHTTIDTITLYRDAKPEHRAMLVADMARCTAEDGIDQAEYLEYLACWEGDAVSYLKDNGMLPDAVSTPTVGQETAAAVQQAEEETAKALADADKTLKAAGKAVAQGEAAYCKGWLEGGRLADLFVHQRMAIPHGKRDVAIELCKAEFARYAGEVVDPNQVIAAYQAWRLLCDSQGLAKKAEKARMSYSHFRQAWRLVVERVNPNTVDETWAILPGVEEECRKTFANALEAGLNRGECIDAAKAMARQSMAHVNKLAAEKAGAAAKLAKDAEAEKDAARAAVSKANAVKEAAEKAVKDAATDAEREQRTADAEAAKEELLAKQRAHSEKINAEAEATRKQALAEAEAKKAKAKQAEAEAQAQAKADKKAGVTVTVAKTPAAPVAKPEECRAPQNLLATAKVALPKDLADMVTGMISSSDTPDDVLELVLKALSQHVGMSKLAHRACQAGLDVFTKAAQPSTAGSVNAALEARGGINVGKVA